MDQLEARFLLARHLSTYRGRANASLVDLIGTSECAEMVGASGQRYQCEVNLVWDDKPGGNVRVLAAIDDGSLRRAVLPTTDDFIMAPDGSFVGETGAG